MRPSPDVDGPAVEYREFAPPTVAGDSLACLWTRVVPTTAADEVRVLPDTCVDVIWQSGAGAFLAGPDTAANLTVLPPGTVLVGARFRAGAGGRALGLPLSELRDAQVPIDAVLPALAEQLPRELAPREALQSLVPAVLRLCEQGPDPAVLAAARRLARPGGTVAGVADQLGLSERQLLRRCQHAVGYGPKVLHRVLRFRRFLAAAHRSKLQQDLADLALEAGYADQPHLTRECVEISGLTPTALVATGSVPVAAG